MASTTRQRLLDTAFDLFYMNGIHAIGLDRIIDTVGVSKQTFYNHFECKDDLILEVLKMRSEWEQQTLRQMLQDMAGEDPVAQLRGIFDVFDAWFNRPDFRGCIFANAAGEFPSANDPAHQFAAEHSLKFHAFLLNLCRRADADDPEVLAEQLFVLVEGAFATRHITGNDRAAQIARNTADLLLERHLPATTLPHRRSA